MSHDRHTPAATARSKRRIARIGMALTSAAFVSGAIALPASAATAPATRPSVPSVRSDTPPDDDTIDIGGDVGVPDEPVPASESGGGGSDGTPHRDPNGAYGPSSCQQGYVWRDSYDGDDTCVTPQSRQAYHDVINPHRQPGGGAYGPSTCMPGYVWRESYDGDAVCVTPEEREVAKSQRS
ncbi:hypothetical protein ACFVFI_16005 [Streptomyces sp. NPDC057705]|uniref:hypothetical protein n=1 Tax=Streptomyces sp. NPDC057705 TaxID=3346222 RepID=UPI003686A0CD